MNNNVYFWWGVGLLLMAIETFMPGAFMLWFGFAAAALGVVVLLAPGIPPLWQVALFAVLSFVSVGVYRRFFRKGEPVGDQPLLNKRGAQLVGRTFELEQPIENGFGKIKIGDALWTVAGADLAVGERVTVIDTDGLTLRVRPA
jgi:inner membrane protein